MGLHFWNIARSLFANPPHVTIQPYYLLRELAGEDAGWRDVANQDKYASFSAARSALAAIRSETRSATAIVALSNSKSQNQKALIVLSRPRWRGCGDRSILRKIENFLFDALHDWKVRGGFMPLVFGERSYVVEYFAGGQWVEFEKAGDVKTAIVRMKALRKAARTMQGDEYNHVDQGFPAGSNLFYAFRVRETSSRDYDDAIVRVAGGYTREQKTILGVASAVCAALAYLTLFSGKPSTPSGPSATERAAALQAAREREAMMEGTQAQYAVQPNFAQQQAQSALRKSLETEFSETLAGSAIIANPVSRSILDKAIVGTAGDHCALKALDQMMSAIISDTMIVEDAQIEGRVRSLFGEFGTECLKTVGSDGSDTRLTPDDRLQLLRTVARSIQARKHTQGNR